MGPNKKKWNFIEWKLLLSLVVTRQCSRYNTTYIVPGSNSHDDRPVVGEARRIHPQQRRGERKGCGAYSHDPHWRVTPLRLLRGVLRRGGTPRRHPGARRLAPSPPQRATLKHPTFPRVPTLALYHVLNCISILPLLVNSAFITTC